MVLATLGSATCAHAQKRVALVVGNSAYQHTPKLANPRNDATDIGASLRKHGFQVIDGMDLEKASFERKVRDFSTALQGASVGVFFFAGHGLQVAGHNYLVPVDARLSTADALEFEMVRVDTVQRIMERQAPTNVLFLDACRDNPLARNLARAMGTRSSDVGRGLAAVESGVGTLISFSTQPGNVALDGTGRNSPFAGALVRYMTTTSDSISDMLIAVRNDVRKETQNRQVPWEHSALTGRFYFSATPLTPQASEAERTWPWIKDTSNPAVLESFIKQFGDTPLGGMARARLEELRKQQAAVAPRQPAPKPAPSQPPQPAAAVVPSPSPGRCDGAETLVGAERRCLTAKETFKDCSDCPEMVVIPAGEFLMGSPLNEPERGDNEGPQRKVTFARPFAVGKFEVTFAEWDACVADGGWFVGGCRHKPEDRGWGRGKRPVIDVSWYHTKEYVAWLSKKTGKAYRLLTEAEWEYTARAGTTTPFSTGRTIATDQANFNGQSSYGGGIMGAMGLDRQRTLEVGSFRPNAFGLHDMHGNVWEWVEDCMAAYKDAPADGSAKSGGDCGYAIVRGGSWGYGPIVVRSAHRYMARPEAHGNLYGFRVARALPPP